MPDEELRPVNTGGSGPRIEIRSGDCFHQQPVDPARQHDAGNRQPDREDECKATDGQRPQTGKPHPGHSGVSSSPSLPDSYILPPCPCQPFLRGEVDTRSSRECPSSLSHLSDLL
jgi:hypothetical protein